MNRAAIRLHCLKLALELRHAGSSAAGMIAAAQAFENYVGADTAAAPAPGAEVKQETAHARAPRGK